MIGLSSISEEEQVWIDKLNRIGVGYFRPLIAVSLIPRLGISKEDRLAFYKAVERLIFIIFRMAGYQSSYKSSDYYRKTREVYMGNLSLTDITEDLKETTDDNASDAIKVFLTKMNRRFVSNDGFYSWRDLRYFLFEYEYSLASKYKLDKLSWAVLTKVVKDKITVEHILPQTPTKYYWRNNFRQFSDEEKTILAASLGNMLPLSQSINSKLQNDSFDEKKTRGYENGCHCEVEISKEDIWDAEHIYDRGIKLLQFMESRWDFEFESREQMEELLHVQFVHDGREIPPELEEDIITPITKAEDDDSHDRADYIASLILSWAKQKNEAGEIHLDETCCGRRYIRFTTDATSEILPDAEVAESGWGTKNHYFYEVINALGKKIQMKIALSSENMPDDLKKISEHINEHFPSRIQKEDWLWRTPFSTERVKINEDTSDDEIVNILNDLYAQLMDFEKRLVEVMRGNND